MPELRIHFTEGDLGRTRLKLGMDPMWELVSSIQILQHREGGLYFDDWRRGVRERAALSAPLRTAIRLLATIAPHASYFPDLLTPPVDVPDADTGAEVVLATPPSQLRAEMDQLKATTGPLSWLDDLACGRSETLRQLRTALRTYAAEIVVPHHHVIDDALHLERASRLDTYLNHGPEAVLATFEPMMKWRRPMLTVDYPVDRDLHLNGRGLLLVPCYFCLGQPVALADPDMRPVLVFPLAPASLLPAGPRHGDALGALLGTTRADLLRSLTTGMTTTHLAKRNRITPATATHHTTVLRNAGLINTRRDGNRAIHTITTLGLSLLARS